MRRIRWMGIIGVSGIAMIGAGGCGNNTQAVQAQGASPKPTAVETTHPERRDVSRPITLPADIQAMEETTLYAKVPGYLDSILVDKGDRVKAGQLVATIRAPELAAESAQAQQTWRSTLESAKAFSASERKTEEENGRSRIAVEKVREDYAQSIPAIERAKALLRQAEAEERRSRASRVQAEAALDESKTQVDRATADLEAARSDQKLADLTYGRYRGIYEKDSKLIARQMVDEAESRAEGARSKVEAARKQLESARAKVRSSQALVNVAQQQIEEAAAGVAAAKQSVALAESQRRSLNRQLEMAQRDVGIGLRQKEATSAQARQYGFQASAQHSAAGRLALIADYARITAPFSGIVVKRFVDRGAFIQTASTSQNAAPIVVIANMDSVRIYIHVPESEERLVRPGTPVTLTAASDTGEPIKARVTRISSSLDLKSRTLLAEADLPNPGHKLIPGGYVTAKVALEKHPGVIALPASAVGSEKAGKFVFIVDKGKARRVTVTTGFDDGAFVEIQDGLKGNEEVVVTGRDNLAPGAPVTTAPWVAGKPK